MQVSGCFTETETIRLFFEECLESRCRRAIFIGKNAMAMKYRLEESVPHCLECGDPLPYGRGDRKFCSDGCRNRFHNRDARRYRVRFTRTVGILQKNHDILKHLIRIGVHSVSKAELVQLGYRLDFVTSYSRERRRTVCHCFDIVFHVTETRLTNVSMDPLADFEMEEDD